HIHVAEGMCDVVDAVENYGGSVVDRLSQHKILKKESILAHCIHLAPADFRIFHNTRCWLVHNPRSNMNNNVGHAPVHLFGDRAALGTDGFPADMFEEARTGFLKIQDSGSKVQGVDLTKFLQGGQELASEIFGVTFGTLTNDSVADLLVTDYQPLTSMTEDNLQGHFLFGMRSSMVESVIVGGKWIVKDREVQGVDVTSIVEKSRKVATKLWERMNR
ncbi:MAG: amidohydrolase family protein, partial [Bacteroidota bacterium]